MEENTFPRWLVATFTLVLAVMLAGGTWFYRDQERLLRKTAEDELQAIAQLKMDQIVKWRSDRVEDAAVLMRSPFFIEGVERWMAAPQKEDAGQIAERLRALHQQYHYYDVLLVDDGGKIRMSTRALPVESYHEEAIEALAAALHNRRPMLTNIHAGPGDMPPHLDIIAPLFFQNDESAEPVAAILLQTDARQFLYPLIQSWPIPSVSAETLLVQREGDSVLFLNDLRHQKESSALNLRIPLNRTDVPAVMAVLGREGVARGKDYRGIDVLSVLKAIPDSPWFMVAKVDTGEVFSTWRFLSLLILALILMVFLAAAAAAGLVWQRNKKENYRRLVEAQSALRESEERHRMTLMSVGDAVIATDAHGLIGLMNPVAERLTGWNQAEAADRPLEEIFRIVNEETRKLMDSPLQRVLQEGVVIGLANHSILIARDGRESPIADSAAPIRSENGTITGVVLVFRDQTAERTVQAFLKRERDFSTTLIHSSPAFFVAIDGSGRTMMMNPAMLRTLGYTLEEVTGRDYLEAFVPEAERKTLREVFSKLAAPGESTFNENRVLTKDGRQRLMEWHGRSVLKTDGSLDFFFGVGMDITERRRAESALRESEEQYRLLVNTLPDVVYSLKGDLTVLHVSPAVENVLGYTAEELTGGNLTELNILAPECFEKALSDISHVLAGHVVSSSVYEFIRRDGGRVVAEVSGAPLLRQGEIVAVISVARDITDRIRREEENKRLEKQLLQAQKMEALGNLAGGIAHDFNNLLMTIQGNASIALLDSDPSDPHFEYLKSIEGEVRSASMLTKQLLGLASIGLYEVRPTVMNEVLEKTVSLFGRTKKEIVIHRKYEERLWAVDSDAGQMEQVFMNLFINAWQAMPGGGNLFLETKNLTLDDDYVKAYHTNPGKYVKISITDTGVGMDEKTKLRIFEPFFTTKEMGRGTGLGLSMVYGIIKGHKGFVNVYSEPGRGTIFNIYLPASDKEIVSEMPAVSEILEGKGTILLVDDEVTVLKVSTRLLERLGYTVLAVKNGEEALALYRKERDGIDLVLLDLVMPEMSGGEVFARLREINRDVRVILLSGYSIDGEARHILEQGCNGFLQKPVTLSELSRKIKEVLDG